MTLIGPVIGCKRMNVVSIGYEISSQSMISINIRDSSGTLVGSGRSQSIPDRFCIQDISLTHTCDRYFVELICLSEIRKGSFTSDMSVAITSCNNRDLSSPLMWNHLCDMQISHCLHIGDNIYMDNGSEIFSCALAYAERSDDLDREWDGLTDIFREGYRTLWSTPHMQRILSSCHNIFIWDDHDICDSWDQDICIDMSLIKSHGWKGAALLCDREEIKQICILAAIQVYCEYQLPLSLGSVAVHIPGSFTYSIHGKKILFVDRRMHIVAGTPLIPDDTHDIDVIVTGVPLFYLHPLICNDRIDKVLKKTIGIRDLSDHWMLSLSDMREILSLIRDGTIIFSGDVHMCGMTEIIVNDHIRCRQYTSSAISSPPPPRLVLWLLQYLYRYRYSVLGYTCDVTHQSWTRDNGYIISNLSDTTEYVLSSMLK